MPPDELIFSPDGYLTDNVLLLVPFEVVTGSSTANDANVGGHSVKAILTLLVAATKHHTVQHHKVLNVNITRAISSRSSKKKNSFLVVCGKVKFRRPKVTV
ncbi:hypothetical protein RUM43_011297 [Polyplax serrata]|uniref:Uncharacterized protein n=1 Tax=Polyplax serrata TaxID=468196 RepID=A0AAN8NLT6_POLSC